MASKTTILVTRANRGIGRALVEHYLFQANHTVIASVRDPNHDSAKSLSSLSRGNGSSQIIVKIESTSEADAKDAVKAMTSSHGIKELDIVVANAGLSKVFPIVSEARTQDIQQHFDTNVLGVVRLFQAILPLLNATKAPKFITLGITAGSMGDMKDRNFPNVAYGTLRIPT